MATGKSVVKAPATSDNAAVQSSDTKPLDLVDKLGMLSDVYAIIKSSGHSSVQESILSALLDTILVESKHTDDSVLSDPLSKLFMKFAPASLRDKLDSVVELVDASHDARLFSIELLRQYRASPDEAMARITNVIDSIKALSVLTNR